MAGNKKPRKKRTWKPVASNPLVPRDPLQQELPGLVGLEALGKEWFAEEHVYDLLAHADMAKRVAKSDAVIEAAKAIGGACLSILARQGEIGRLGVSGQEMRAIKENFATTIKQIRDTPQQVIWKAAMAANREFDKMGALVLAWT